MNKEYVIVASDGFDSWFICYDVHNKSTDKENAVVFNSRKLAEWSINLLETLIDNIIYGAVRKDGVDIISNNDPWNPS